MKKIIGIIIFSFLSIGSVCAEDFYLSCEGKINSTSTMHNSTDDFFEEWKITTVNKEIFIAELINSTNWNYRSLFLGKDLSFTNNVIYIEVYNQETGSEYNMKKYAHNISLNSGRFAWSQFLESPSSSWAFRGQGKCEGYKEILSYFNK